MEIRGQDTHFSSLVEQIALAGQVWSGGGLSPRRLGFAVASGQLANLVHERLVAARSALAGAGADGGAM